MAGLQDGNGVAVAGSAYGPGGLRFPDGGGKLAVGGFHGDLADAQIGRQLAFARQACATGQGAGHDVRADSVVELLVERLLVVRFEMVSQHGRRLLSLRLLQNLC